MALRSAALKDTPTVQFHPVAFSLVWDMPRLSPRQHVTAFRRLLTAWHFEAHGWRTAFRSGGCE